ncbi:LacI family DNA-binding transcriptional regulator [Phytoactinopolyspora alkaliphila]|uniref:LacI family DNA-binding transcriptional regulator n=1 Tax=Phytoactinopolyspora alkaliphila TaxID=1783498 RepID=UPI001C20A773
MAVSTGEGVTIRDVAARAGVSIATVSRVLRGNIPVSEPTKERVLTVVSELGYRPSVLGRSLAEGRHAANGIVFPDLSGPYYAEVVLGYEEAAGELGRSVLILSTHGRDAAPEMVRELARRVDGMVVLGRTVSDEVVQEIAARGLPIVLLARSAAGEVDSVNAENVASAIRLTEHLIDHGHRTFAVVGGAESSPDTMERWAGVRTALLRAGLTPPAEPVPAGLREEEGTRVAEDLLVAGVPDAVVCANDELALGVITGLRAAGIDVPGQVAVTGWDDVMAARYAGLTTVRQPMRELGVRAARMLDLRIRGDAGPARHEVLPTNLVVRNSCGRHEPPDLDRR